MALSHDDSIANIVVVIIIIILTPGSKDPLRYKQKLKSNITGG